MVNGYTTIPRSGASFNLLMHGWYYRPITKVIWGAVKQIFLFFFLYRDIHNKKFEKVKNFQVWVKKQQPHELEG